MVQMPRAVVALYVGDCSPGEASHSLMCEAVSNWRAFRSSRSRLAPGDSAFASSRRRRASAASRSESETVCLNRRRGMALLHCFARRERNLRSHHRQLPQATRGDGRDHTRCRRGRMFTSGHGGTKRSRAGSWARCGTFLKRTMWRGRNIPAVPLCGTRFRLHKAAERPIEWQDRGRALHLENIFTRWATGFVSGPLNFRPCAVALSPTRAASRSIGKNQGPTGQCRQQKQERDPDARQSIRVSDRNGVRQGRPGLDYPLACIACSDRRRRSKNARMDSSLRGTISRSSRR